MRWLELTVEADAEAVEAVSEVLGRVAAGTAVRPTRLVRDPGDELAVCEDPSAPYEVTAHIPDDEAASEAVDATERALWHLQAFGLRPVGELRVRRVDDADWLERWKEGYAPQRIGRVVVVPSWLDEPLGEGEVAVRLDPGMAFGTGLHPTTRGCLTLLQRAGPMPLRVMDVGSGSGILALAALRLGAGHVDCLDTDAEAVRATAANAAANGLAERVTAAQGTLPAEPPRERYPLVLANLVAAILVELAPRLAVHLVPGGTLIAGGVIVERHGEVEDALRAAGLHIAERLRDGDWISLRVTRPRRSTASSWRRLRWREIASRCRTRSPTRCSGFSACAAATASSCSTVAASRPRSGWRAAPASWRNGARPAASRPIGSLCGRRSFAGTISSR